MRGISIKAVIVGNVLNPVLLFAVTLVVMTAAGAALQKPGESLAAAMQGLVHDPSLLLAIAVAMLPIVIFVGYVAASLSGEALLLNAALSGVGLILWNFVDLFRPSTTPDNALVTVVAWVAPLFAVVGGSVRARRVAGGAGPVRWGQALRFALAIMVALPAGLIAFLLLARVAPFISIPSAIGVSLLAAYVVAPPHQRVLAAWTMLCIAAAGAVGIFLAAALGGTLKFIDWFLLLAVAAAAFSSRVLLRPVREAESSARVRPAPLQPEKIVIQPAPRTDPAVQHLWKRPEQKSEDKP